MTVDIATKRARFRALHAEGCFVIPNPWDAGSARRLAAAGFQAIASSSAGFAWAMGRDDGEVAVDEVLEHLRVLNEATDLPVNADFEHGFADTAGGVAHNVTRAIEAGVSGLSIEDRRGGDLFPVAVAVERIRAAHEAIAASGEDVVLVGRCEGYLIGQRDLAATIKRLVAYAEAGADCLFAPGVSDHAEIREIVAAVAPKPVNVVILNPSFRVPELAALGVRRVSTGGGLARAAWKGFDEAVKMLTEVGTLPPRD
jgi:2-methylisocitrate lyase-like PEP mutase family enzyme